MKRILLISALVIVVVIALKTLIPRMLVKQKTKSEQGRDELVAGIADIANAIRIPVLATTGTQPMRTMQTNPVFANSQIYGLQGATRFPTDTGNNVGAVSGAQKTGVVGGGLRSWLGF